MVYHSQTSLCLSDLWCEQVAQEPCLFVALVEAWDLLEQQLGSGEMMAVPKKEVGMDAECVEQSVDKLQLVN